MVSIARLLNDDGLPAPRNSQNRPVSWMDKALDKFKASEIEWKERRQVLHRQIKEIDIEIEKLVAAISAGGDIPVLVTAVKAANDRRAAVSRDLAEVDSQVHSDADYDQLSQGT